MGVAPEKTMLVVILYLEVWANIIIVTKKNLTDCNMWIKNLLAYELFVKLMGVAPMKIMFVITLSFEVWANITFFTKKKLTNFVILQS